jgi:hypothetical protein
MVRLRNVFLWCWIMGIGTELLLFPLANIFPLVMHHSLTAMGALSVCWFGGACAALLVQSRLQKHIQHAFRSHHIASLNYWNDGLLARASTACFPRPVARHFVQARTELLNQLPILTEDKAYLLHSRERRVLYQTLKGKDAELISSVLRAIPVLGDARALPFVRHLAEGNALAAKNAELRTEAQSSLSRLQAILDLSRGSQGLLRASAAPQAPTEQLLHPVQGNHETDPGELLRPEVQK